MKFTLPSEFCSLARYVPEFVDLCGSSFHPRIRQLRNDINASPFLAKIVVDYHWLELCLFDLSQSADTEDGRYLENWCAVKFAAMCIETHRRLTSSGKAELNGRLRDALKSDSGFAPLYAEMDIALRFLSMGFDVGFEDMEGRAPFDFLMSKNADKCEVECKSFSVDAGRKIHRRDFYRLAHAVESDLSANSTGRREALVITLEGRLSGRDVMRKKIAESVRLLIYNPHAQFDEHEQFRVAKEDISGLVPDQGFHAGLKKRFGENIHAVSALADTSGRTLIVRSMTEDDPSKPVLQNIRNAAEQLSKTRPGFVALQFNDTELSDRPPDNLLRRVTILSNVVFQHYKADHVAGVIVGSYRNAVGEGANIAAPEGAVIVNTAIFAELGLNIGSIFHPFTQRPVK